MTYPRASRADRLGLLTASLPLWSLPLWSIFGADTRASPRHEANAPYRSFTHLSDPSSLTATLEKEMCTGLPSAVPRCSVEIRSGPAFL
jgi:hypothetical protein